MKIPLPSISTLNKYIKDINIEPGFLNVVFKILDLKSSSMSGGERVCSLSFDEMSLTPKYSYDRSSDTVIPNHKKVQVVMARGILKNWKQPIYYSFDTNMTKEILFGIINRLSSCNFYVSSIVCDLGGTNQKLLNELGISQQKAFLMNPDNSGHKVHVFADVPHLLERNSIAKLSSITVNVIDLPREVTELYLKCRTFFRIRMLNKSLRQNYHREEKKINKQNRGK